MRSISEQILLVTGSTDGLGRALSKALAARGATVLVHGRDPRRLVATDQEIRSATSNAKLRTYCADFRSLAEVRRLAAEIEHDVPRLDGLINNAGIGAGPDTERREESADGYELRFAVNYLAPFLLTELLLPLLRRSAAARIVNVASAGQAPIDFDDVMLERDYDGVRAYRQSKLAQILFAFELAEQLRGEGSRVTVNAVHPASLMDTKMVHEWFGYTSSTVEEGLESVSRLVTAPELAGVSGHYFDRSEEARALAQADDPEARRRLWRLSEQLVAAARTAESPEV